MPRMPSATSTRITLKIRGPRRFLGGGSSCRTCSSRLTVSDIAGARPLLLRRSRSPYADASVRPILARSSPFNFDEAAGHGLRSVRPLRCAENPKETTSCALFLILYKACPQVLQIRRPKAFFFVACRCSGATSICCVWQSSPERASTRRAGCKIAPHLRLRCVQ